MEAPEQTPAGGNGQPLQTPPADAHVRTCVHCGQPLAQSQEWCLNCGAGAPGSLENPRWRSTTAIAVGVAVLALGAAAAAYAALNEHSPKPARVVKTIAAIPPPTTTTPPATTPKATLPTSPAHTKLPIPVQKTKLPKIPLTAIAPNKTSTTKSSTGTGTGTGTGGKSESATKTSEEASSSESSEPTPILLDTNAASTYNPYDLPASYFGDASLVIDGDTSTAWTAQVDPATAPSMAEGVLLDLKALLRVSALQLDTQTPGMTVQVYGTTASKAPESILAKSWTPLDPPKVVKKRESRIELGHQQKGFRYVLLWISKAPADAIGTAQAPGHVDVNELELFPAG